MDIKGLCLDFGAAKAEEIPVYKLALQPDLHDYCRQNSCGRYGRNYSCPPHIGEAADLIAELKSFNLAVIWQNIYTLEDSFDFEGMIDGQAKHNAMAQDIARLVYAKLGRENALMLSAGGCSICEICGINTNQPCRDANNTFSSLEAYGVNVSQISEVSSLKYINGANTVTYFAGVFLK